MADIHLTISPSQRELLMQMLSEASREKRVGVRRASYSHEYREQLEHEEELIQQLIDKLTEAASTM